MLGKIVRWLLPVSLALNLFFVILAVRNHPFWHPHAPDPNHFVDFMKPNLPAADAEILQKSFETHKAAMDAARKTNDGMADKIRQALQANPFDPAALTQALKEGQAGHVVMEDAMAASFVDAASKMSPEGRAALAAHRLGPPGPGGHPGGPGEHGPGGPGGPGFPPGPPPPDGPDGGPPGPPPPPPPSNN